MRVLVERAGAVRIAKLAFDVDTVSCREFRRTVALAERLKRRVERERRVRIDAGWRWIGVGICPRVAWIDVEGVGSCVPLLPDPEHIIDEAMMEEEDGIEPCRVVLTHVAVRTGNRRVVALAGIVDPPTAR